MIRFGEFRLHQEEHRLWKNQVELKLTPKAMELLIYLALRPGEVVRKEELFKALWPDTFVSDHALTVQIREIRKVLGEQAGEQPFIETRHRRGYRFVPNGSSAAPPPPEIDPVPQAETRPFTPPETRYARSGEVNIAYQVLGAGPVDIVFVMGWVSHLEYFWTEPHFAAFLRRLASFSRLILFDKRGTGLSDRVPLDQLPTLEQRMDDLRAVMDAVGSAAAVIVSVSEGGPMSALFAATYPEKTMALVMIGTYAKRIRDESYPWGPTAEERAQFLELIRDQWGGPVGIEQRAPSLAADPAFRNWWATYLRMGASPSAAIALTRMNAEIDVRHVLEAVRVPALVVHRTGDRTLLVEEGRYVAQHIQGARFLELPGNDHLPFVGDRDEILDEIEEFVTTVSHAKDPERVLATVLSADFGQGDTANRGALDARAIQQVELFRGNLRQTANGHFLATFDGPARALRCAMALGRIASRLGFGLRAALHTGECDLLEGNAIGGPTVAITARIQERSANGEILASSTVRDLVAGSGIHFAAAGVLADPGLSREWRLFRLDRDSPATAGE
jgi:DNA-binding winged helix-turn-helix (wHTH) protein/pimeloyl-ACP methyl ester carboxylesterase